MAHLYCCVVVPHLLPELSSLPLLLFLMCSQNQESRGFVTELGYLSDLKKKADEVVGVLVCLCASGPVCHSVLSLPPTMGVIHGPTGCSAVVVSGLLD